mgnify:CR=1 FL=1|tara:strand:+ start:7087 stop:7590 length:504 start_codon:yes stop_codon:yes gene_type:complete
MEQIIEQYQNISAPLRRYLPDAIGINLTPIAPASCENIETLNIKLIGLLGTECPQGWLVRQSSTLMLTGSESLPDLLNEEFLLEAELVHQHTSVKVYYQDCTWWVTGISVCNSAEPNALAIPHHFAVDRQRFKAGYQACYWVIWQTHSESIQPVAQCLRHVCTVEET